jgi:hypothetical protein
MRTSFVKYLLLLMLFFYLPFSSWAWGMLGHRIVGQIADSYLSKKARKEIKNILGNETIAMSANWADFIKSDTAYKYLDPWHYIDFEKGLAYDSMNTRLQKDTGVNAYSRIQFLVAELKRKDLPADKQKMYLRLLIHFAGDVHQPLHVSPVGTAGGNTVRVTWFNQSTNLHRVWDSQLIEYQQLSYTEYAAAINHTTAAQRKAWQGQPISQWLFESYRLSQGLISDISEANAKLGYEYNFKHIETLNEQLLKGGVRLAGLLNEIYG